MSATWTIPAKSFDAYTLSADADGTAIDLGHVCTDVVAQLIVNYSSPDYWNIGLNGSMDGTNWYALGVAAPADTWYAPGTPSGSTLSALGTAFNQPARYVRAAASPGAGAPVITVLISAREG